MTFDNWLEEVEGYRLGDPCSLRMERAYDELVVNPKDPVDNWQNIKSWLKSAYEVGYSASQAESQALTNSLKEEIRIQRKEIAGLREERRLILDADKLPELGFKEE